MGRVKKYANNTTEALIDAEMELYDEFAIEEKSAENSPAEVEMTGPETKNGVIVNSLFVKVRKEPSFEADVLEVLRQGDKVTILGKNGEFYKVSTSTNKLAYISLNFVKEE